jgi:N-acyl homoserine lactone hydrolase
VKLYLLNLGQCNVDKGMVLTPGSGVGERILIPIVGFLIETDDGQHVLVDTGMHRKHIEDPEATFRGHPFGEFLTPIMTPEDDIVNRLAELNLTPDDIDILVSTHFHFDHAGNHADFGNARIVTQKIAYDFAIENPGAFPEDIWNLPHLKYEMLDGDVELLPGITLLHTSGHVPGHMSVVVRLPNTGTVVIAIDAIYIRENYDRDNWAGMALPEEGKRNAQRLVEIAERENGMLITGHDPAAWSEFKHSPLFYD